ncbi:MAG: transcriptional repressor [Coxiella sp. (in: Bacteria)]|nr:MAG: transcriptional repressor [Coxiella sp. (in: g-proteobacteria)]
MVTLELLATQYNFKLTELRKDILDVLLKIKKPLKAYDLLEHVKKIRPNAKPPTVYRVLDFLVNKGVLHRLDKHNAYALCQLDHSHDIGQTDIDILLVCKMCMGVTELSDRVLTALIDKIQEERSMIIDSKQIELQCICKSCAAH